MTASAKTRRAFGGALALALASALLLPTGSARAQQAETDARWLPWLGCWSEVGTSGELLCLRPGRGGQGVELVTVRDGQVSGVELLLADGTARETSREGCTGTERAEFSSDGHRVYVRSDFVCEGDVNRTGTGLMAFVAPAEWVRVQAVEVAGETAAVTERYRKVPEAAAADAGLEPVTAGREMAVRTARQAAAAPPTTDDLVEAGGRVDAEAVKTWVAERDEPLDVDAGKLARLADAGVADEVIDVVVAVSFPERFAVDRDARGRVGGAGPGYRGRFGADLYGRRPFYRDPFSYGYTPFGYRFGSYGWWYGTRSPTVIVVRPRDDDGVGDGRVVNGRGYTRGSGTDPRPASPAAGIEAPSGGSVSPSGMSSGRSSGSTGRKAKPREGSSGGDSGPGGG